MWWNTVGRFGNRQGNQFVRYTVEELALAHYDQLTRYSISGAAYLLRLTKNQVRRLANGYTYMTSYGKRTYKTSVLAADREDPSSITFPELIELSIVASMLKHRAGARALRRE